MCLLIVLLNVTCDVSLCADLASMCFAAACLWLAMSKENNIRLYEPVHVYDDMPLVTLLE